MRERGQGHRQQGQQRQQMGQMGQMGGQARGKSYQHGPS